MFLQWSLILILVQLYLFGIHLAPYYIVQNFVAVNFNGLSKPAKMCPLKVTHNKPAKLDLPKYYASKYVCLGTKCQKLT